MNGWKMRLAVCFTVVLSIGVGQAVWGEIQTKPISYQYGDAQLNGVLVYDDAMEGRQPGVLVMHEWWGLNDYARGRAVQLAEMGYVAFAVDMYGHGETTNDVNHAQQLSGQFHADPAALRGRAQAGLAVLAKQEQVDPQRIAAIGYCFGGMTVQQLAYSGADVKGVASFHGSLSTPAPEDVPNVKAKIMICHGGADAFIPDEQVTAFIQALRATDIDWQFIAYSGAKHSFTNPSADQRGMDGLKYNADADRRSWAHMKQFFDEIFSQGLPAE